MQTRLPEQYRRSPKGRRAEDILRSCVHCGFCNATCPTYQITGDELDGPRGRIYLIKEVLEAQAGNPVAMEHLDRCLTCRACETTCPSGVAYGELLEIGREFLHGREKRGLFARVQRRWLERVVPYRARFGRWLALGRLFRWLLPSRLKQQIPLARQKTQDVDEFEPIGDPLSTVLLLEGCVQRVVTPGVTRTLEALLARRGIACVRVEDEACCGGLNLHLGSEDAARDSIRRNLDALSDSLHRVDAVVSTASGCGVTLKDYPRLLDPDDSHAVLAAQFARKVKDVGEYLHSLDLLWAPREGIQRVALHLPCTLQHGQKLGAEVAELLRSAGYELVPVRDSHLCCGSAGTYSILQPELAQTLRASRVEALQEMSPDVIATANVGCETHLAGAADVPVKHWVELLT